MRAERGIAPYGDALFCREILDDSPASARKPRAGRSAVSRMSYRFLCYRPPRLVFELGPKASLSADVKPVFALHLINGEHYSGAERVQDLLAKQLPQFGCEVGFACVKPQRFPNARETKTCRRSLKCRCVVASIFAS